MILSRLVLLLLCGSSLAHAGLHTQVLTQRYEVYGLSGLEVLSQLRHCGPKEPGGRRFHAMTRSRLSWHYQKAEGSAGCHITEVNVSLRNHYTLPRWADVDFAPRRLQRQWQRYLQALTAHEQHHGQLAHDAALRIEQRLYALPVANNCERLQQQVERVTGEEVAEMLRQNRNYDRYTLHGLLEGVLFPRLRRQKR